MAHTDPWGVTTASAYSQWFVMTGEWQRESYSFTLTETNLSNKMLMRIIWDPRNVWDPSNLSNVNVHSFYAAGAQLEQGTVMTDFSREHVGEDLFLEKPVDTILKFQDPDGKIIIGDLADGDEFTQKMIGGKLTINNAHPILDLSSAFTVTELEEEPVYEWDAIASDGPHGDATQGGELDAVYEFSEQRREQGNSPFLYPFPDAALNGQAIRVTNDMGMRRWSSGFSNMAWSDKYVGTAEIGYHAHWRADKGVDGGVAMCFPDLNYQDYIFDAMVQARRDAGDWNGREMPSEDLLASKQDYGHRFMQINTQPYASEGKIGLGSLAQYGVRSGDKIRISWMQKSDPIDFEQGGRKGIWVGLNHWCAQDVAPPEPLYVTDEDVWAEDNAFHLHYGGPDDFAYFDENQSGQGGFINRKPTHLEPLNWNFDVDVNAFLATYSIEGYSATGAGGYYVTADGELEQSEAFKWYWKPSGGEDQQDGYWITARLDAAQWPGEEEMSPNAFRKESVVGGRTFLTPEDFYPSYDEYPTNVNISDDGIFKWDRGLADWVAIGEGGAINWSTEYEVEGGNVTLYKRTYRTEALNEGPKSTFMSPCQEYNQWEKASFEFEITDFFALDQDVRLEVRGYYGSFGTAWADKFELTIVKSSLLRPEVQENAVLDDLEFTITNVFDENQIEVDKTYVEASSEQGGIDSSYSVNKYSLFDSGFSVNYITQPSGSSDIFARYEGKILDVQNDLETQKKLVLDKTYEEYGNEINAVMSGPDAINLSTAALNDYFIRFRSKDADNLYTYVITSDDSKSLITNFKPINSETYPGSIAYKLIKPLEADITELDTVFIAEEVTPTLREKIDLHPFIEEKLPDTVLRQPNWSDVDIPIRDRATEYKTHTDLIGKDQSVIDQLEDRILSGSLEKTSINVDYRQYENFTHFSSVEKRINNFKRKVTNIEMYTANSASLSGTGAASGYLSNAAGTGVSGSASEIRRWENSIRETVNGFDDFENYMYFQNSSYVTSSMGEFFENTFPKRSGDGTLTNPYQLYSVSSSQFNTWYSSSSATAYLYDRNNKNRLVNLLPEHISSDMENIEFLHFMDMMGHHYDNIWTHIKALSDINKEG